jgi:transcriptional regulator with XRE-family HTH domain
LAQETLAGWLYVSQATLSRIENGARQMTIDETVWFARALGMPVALRWTAQHEAGEDVHPVSRRSLLGAGVGARVVDRERDGAQGSRGRGRRTSFTRSRSSGIGEQLAFVIPATRLCREPSRESCAVQAKFT